MRRSQTYFRYVISAAIVGLALTGAEAAERKLAAHWPLEVDARDVGPHGLATKNQGVTFAAVQPSEAKPSARFDGRGSHLIVEGEAFDNFSKGNFTLALWVQADQAGDEELGDLITQFDPQRRVGFQLSLRTNSGVTSCQSNTRQLQFGIDAGSEP